VDVPDGLRAVGQSTQPAGKRFQPRFQSVAAICLPHPSTPTALFRGWASKIPHSIPINEV